MALSMGQMHRYRTVEQFPNSVGHGTLPNPEHNQRRIMLQGKMRQLLTGATGRGMRLPFQSRSAELGFELLQKPCREALNCFVPGFGIQRCAADGAIGKLFERIAGGIHVDAKQPRSERACEVCGCVQNVGIEAIRDAQDDRSCLQWLSLWQWGAPCSASLLLILAQPAIS